MYPIQNMFETFWRHRHTAMRLSRVDSVELLRVHLYRRLTNFPELLIYFRS